MFITEKISSFHLIGILKAEPADALQLSYDVKDHSASADFELADNVNPETPLTGIGRFICIKKREKKV